MRMGSLLRTRAIGTLLLAATLSLGGGCVSVTPVQIGTYDYFVVPTDDDAWSHKIIGRNVPDLEGQQSRLLGCTSFALHLL